MTAMNDDDLGTLLQKLPRHEASPEFTDRVLERLDEPAPVNRRAWVIAAAAAAVLVSAVVAALAVREANERRETAERLEMMRNEYRALELELEELRALTSDVQPVIELGGTEQVDFVFDLRRLAEERGRARAQPTSHSPR